MPLTTSNQLLQIYKKQRKKTEATFKCAIWPWQGLSRYRHCLWTLRAVTSRKAEWQNHDSTLLWGHLMFADKGHTFSGIFEVTHTLLTIEICFENSEASRFSALLVFQIMQLKMVTIWLWLTNTLYLDNDNLNTVVSHLCWNT